MSFHLTRVWMVLFCLVVLVGCSSTVKLSPRDRENTRTIALPDRVLLGMPYHWSQGEAVSSSFGAIGAAAALSDGAEQAALRRAAEREEVDLRQIILEEFESQIRGRQVFEIVERDKADATLEVDVPRYGLAVSSAFSSGMKPVLDIAARLKRSDGRVIWQEHGSETGETDSSYSFSDYMTRPELLREAWRETAQVVVKSLIGGLAGTSTSNSEPVDSPIGQEEN